MGHQEKSMTTPTIPSSPHRNITLSPPEKLRGTLKVPGDRSITVRAVLLGGIAEGESVVRDYLVSDDTTACITCMKALGVEIAATPTELWINGRGLHRLRDPSTELFCDSSGATMRLMSGLMSGQNFASVLNGSAQLRKRPMRRVTQPLGLMGAKIFDVDGCAPLSIEPSAITGLDYTMDVASAQVKSAMLLAGLYAQGEVVVRENATTRDHTERMLAAMGVEIRSERGASGIDTAITMQPVRKPLAPLDIAIPADLSSAAFFMVAGCIHPHAHITLADVGVNMTRTGLMDALRQMGADITAMNVRHVGGEPVADLAVSFNELHAIEISGDLTARMIDEFPVFAVAATQAAGTTMVRDAQELRVKESNRLEGLVEELRKLGAKIEATDDGFVIEGPTRLKGAVLDGRGDHRMAMALAVAALVAEGETTITGAECVSKTYPGFFEDLKTISN